MTAVASVQLATDVAARKRDEAREDCADGDDAACMRYEALEAEIAAEKDRID